MRVRALAINTRPPTEQKIHAGKNEPKMLYSGAWEHPTNVKATVRDKPDTARGVIIRRRPRSVSSIFIDPQSATRGKQERQRNQRPSCSRLEIWMVPVALCCLTPHIRRVRDFIRYDHKHANDARCEKNPTQ